MRLVFRQKMFSWFDSFDITDEEGNLFYKVDGKLSVGHKFMIYDKAGKELAMLKEEVLHLFPHFAIYINGELKGKIRKEFSFLKPRFKADILGYQVEGNWIEWDYTVLKNGKLVSKINKEILHFTDTYILDIIDDNEALMTLMVALAIDAVKCSNGND